MLLRSAVILLKQTLQTIKRLISKRCSANIRLLMNDVVMFYTIPPYQKIISLTRSMYWCIDCQSIFTFNVHKEIVTQNSAKYAAVLIGARVNPLSVNKTHMQGSNSCQCRVRHSPTKKNELILFLEGVIFFYKIQLRQLYTGFSK